MRRTLRDVNTLEGLEVFLSLSEIVLQSELQTQILGFHLNARSKCYVLSRDLNGRILRRGLVRNGVISPTSGACLLTLHHD